MYFATDAQSNRLLKTALAFIGGAIVVLLCGLSMGCASGPCPELGAFKSGISAADSKIYDDYLANLQTGRDLDAAVQGKSLNVPPDVAVAITKARVSPSMLGEAQLQVKAARDLYAAGTTTKPATP